MLTYRPFALSKSWIFFTCLIFSCWSRRYWWNFIIFIIIRALHRMKGTDNFLFWLVATGIGVIICTKSITVKFKKCNSREDCPTASIPTLRNFWCHPFTVSVTRKASKGHSTWKSAATWVNWWCHPCQKMQQFKKRNSLACCDIEVEQQRCWSYNTVFWIRIRIFHSL